LLAGAGGGAKPWPDPGALPNPPDGAGGGGGGTAAKPVAGLKTVRSSPDAGGGVSSSSPIMA
jgi:hypothetical protein